MTGDHSMDPVRDCSGRSRLASLLGWLLAACAMVGASGAMADPELLREAAAMRLPIEPLGVLAGVIPGLGGKLSIVMAIPFLADEDYEQKLGYAREGRTLRVGLEFEL